MELTADEQRLLAAVRENPSLMDFALHLARRFADKQASDLPKLTETQ